MFRSFASGAIAARRRCRDDLHQRQLRRRLQTEKCIYLDARYVLEKLLEEEVYDEALPIESACFHDLLEFHFEYAEIPPITLLFFRLSNIILHRQKHELANYGYRFVRRSSTKNVRRLLANGMGAACAGNCDDDTHFGTRSTEMRAILARR